MKALLDIFSFAIDVVNNCHMEILVQDEEEKVNFNKDYAKRFIHTNESIEGERFYPIIQKERKPSPERPISHHDKSVQ